MEDFIDDRPWEEIIASAPRAKMKDIDWGSLERAYGTAEKVPALIEKAVAGGSEEWGDLISYICHQGSIYESSYASLPELTRIAVEHPDSRPEAVYLAANIIGAMGSDEYYPYVAEKYSDLIEQLILLANEYLEKPADRNWKQYMEEALLMLRGEIAKADGFGE